jgi:hypothetical protein
MIAVREQRRGCDGLRIRTRWAAAMFLLGTTLVFAHAPAGAVCVGDCGGDGRVSIADLQACVNQANQLGGIACPNADQNGDGVDTMDVDNCILSFLNADDCPMVFTPAATNTAAATATSPPTTNTPVSTNTPPATPTASATNTATAVSTSTASHTVTLTPLPTATAAPTCPLTAGRYTITQVSGGQLQVASIDGGTPGGFPFPTGGIVVQDVGPGDADCVHQTVVPATGGFSAPIFCIPGLNFSVQVTQSGCGVGQIDSNGGSDYTVTEVGDTSDSSVTCSLPHAGPCTNGADASVRVDITVGDASADICGGPGTANSIVVIPVMTQTWLAQDFTCPDVDGVFDPGTDTDILLINQNLDFTTDTSTSSWSDIDGDGCSIAGAGPAAGFSRTGACLDIGGGTVTTAATGTIGSDGSPLFDLTFATLLPNTVSGPAASGGATCPSPPTVNFAGPATRCIP